MRPHRYRMHLPAGENYHISRPEWQEWESELPYNKCRTATFFNGQLSVYQLGSTTLGRANDEDTEKGLVYWDVFKAARLDNLKARQLDEGEQAGTGYEQDSTMLPCTL